MKSDFIPRIKHWLSNKDTSYPLVVIGDIDVWNSVLGDNEMKPVFQLPFGENNPKECGLNMLDLKSSFNQIAHINVLAIDCPQECIRVVLKELTPLSVLTIANSKELVLEYVDLYSTVHFNNLIVEII